MSGILKPKNVIENVGLRSGSLDDSGIPNQIDVEERNRRIQSSLAITGGIPTAENSRGFISSVASDTKNLFKKDFLDARARLDAKKERIKKRYEDRLDKLKKTFGSRSEQVKALLKLRDKDLEEVENAAKIEAQNTFNTTSTINDAQLTTLTAYWKVGTSGYPTFYAEATKSGVTFTSTETPTVSNENGPTNEQVKSIVTGNFFNISQQIYTFDVDIGVLTPIQMLALPQYNVAPFELIPPLNVPWQQPIAGPEDKEKEREERKAKRAQARKDAQDKIPNFKDIFNATPKELLAKGKEALPGILYTLGYTILQTQVIPALEKLVREYIEDFIEDGVQSCPPELRELIRIRNKIVDQLNNLARKIERIGRAITGLQKFLSAIILAITTVDIAAIVVAAAAKLLIPTPFPVPGAVGVALNDAQTFIRKATFDKLGNSKLAKATVVIASSSLVLSIIGGWILQALGILSRLDVLIKNCDPNSELTSLTPISDEVKSISLLNEKAQNTQNNTTYQGFILDTQIIPYTPTVNRTQAIGKNAQGIILIKGEPSFTSNNQTLINELKLIIDRDNLQAY